VILGEVVVRDIFFAESDFMTDEFREGDFRAFWGFVILGAVIFFLDLLLYRIF
jgi:hypothetical protein